MAYEQYWAAVRRPSKQQFNHPAHLRRVAQTLRLPQTARQRLEWFIYYDTKASHNARLTCRHFGLTPKTFYVWKKRFNPDNLLTLVNQPRAAARKRVREYTVLQYQRTTALRRAHIRYGKSKLLKLYQAQYPDDTMITDWKIQKMIERSGLILPPPEKRPHAG